MRNVCGLLNITVIPVSYTHLIIILEFKIVPVNDISAAIPVNYKNIDPFKVVDVDVN